MLNRLRLVVYVGIICCMAFPAAAGVDVGIKMGHFFSGSRPQIFLPVIMYPDVSTDKIQMWQNALRITITSVRGQNGAEWYDTDSNFEDAYFTHIQVQANHPDDSNILSGLRTVQLKNGVKANQIARISGHAILRLPGETLAIRLEPLSRSHSMPDGGKILLKAIETKTARFALSRGLKPPHILSIEGLDAEGNLIKGTSRRDNNEKGEIWQHFAAPVAAVSVLIAPHMREVDREFELLASKAEDLKLRTSGNEEVTGSVRIDEILDFGTFRRAHLTLAVKPHPRLPNLPGVQYDLERISAKLLDNGSQIPAEEGPLEAGLRWSRTGNRLVGSLNLSPPKHYTKKLRAFKGEFGLRLPTKVGTLKLTPSDLDRERALYGVRVTLTDITDKNVRATLVAQKAEDIDQRFLGFYATANGKSVLGGSHQAYGAPHGEGVRSVAKWGLKSKPDELLFYIAEGLELARGKFEVRSGGEVNLRFD